MAETERQFRVRIIAVDLEITYRWAELSSGRSRPIVDTLIAATAVVHDLTLVTRNTRDSDDLTLRLLDPFVSSST